MVGGQAVGEEGGWTPLPIEAVHLIFEYSDRDVTGSLFFGDFRIFFYQFKNLNLNLSRPGPSSVSCLSSHTHAM